MAYMSQERKASLSPKIKAICKKYGVKASIAVRNHSTLVLNIKSGKIDFFESFNRICSKTPRYINAGWKPQEKSLDVNPYWYTEHFDGTALKFLSEVIPAMNIGNHDNSRIEVDYFDVGWYVDIKVGRWNKPYILEGE